MRKLTYFSIGFCAACAVSIYLLPPFITCLIGILLFVLAAALFLLRRQDWVRIAALICLGLAAGQLWYFGYSSSHLAPVKQVDGETLSVVIEAQDYSVETDYGISVDGVTEIAGKRYRVRAYVNQTEPLLPGDRVEGQFRLSYTAPGGSDTPTHHSGNGILLLAYPKGEHAVSACEEKTWKHIPAYLRHHVPQLIDSLFPTDTAPFAKALLLGDTSGFDYETETDLSASGIRHVAAVSGLHVTILFSLVYLFSGRKRGLSVLIGAPVLLLFAAMAGFSPSIVRASLMQLLMMLALLLKKEYDPPTALAFAVLVMLTINPLAVTSAGLQLSVASVAGIFLFYDRIQNWLMDIKRMGRWKKGFRHKIAGSITASASISLGTLITTTPLTAWYFGRVSLLSAVTNLLCLWVITLLFCGIIFTCVLGAFWLAAGKAVAWILSWLVRYILITAKIIAQIPLSVIYTESPYVVIWLILIYLLLAVFFLSQKKRVLLFGSCAVLSLCFAVLTSWTTPLFDSYRVTVLDVGQGQCVLLQSQGNAYMVDCGGDYSADTADKAAAALLSRGITRLDGLILTHYDEDHVGAAGNLLYRIQADTVILPEGSDAHLWDEAILKHHRGNIIRAEEDLQILWGDAAITVYSGWNHESSNESSLGVLFQTEKCAILITGDRSIVGEEILLRTAVLPQLDALVVGHHGAGSSTGDALLTATKPKMALISVGADNSYGHPAQAVLDRLNTYGCEIRRTDLEGTIVIKG